MLADLQIHSDALPHHSSWRPGTLIPALKISGVAVFAITDHNTTAGVVAMRAAADQAGLGFVSGCEVDSAHNGKLWHTLMYGIDPVHPAVLALCASVDARNAADAQRLIAALPAEGWRLPAFAQDAKRHINVAEVATALAAHNNLPGRVDGDDEAAGMRFLLARQGSYNPPTVPEVIAAAHTAGGVALIAHPGRSKGVYAIPADAADIGAFVAAGIDGLEVFYPAHTAAQIDFYLSQAQQHGLLISGGSDSHHPDQPLARWDALHMLPLLRRVGLPV
ncbi:MAG: PHP domain-containing protein [Roseiflexaceae bacterium]